MFKVLYWIVFPWCFVTNSLITKCDRWKYNLRTRMSNNQCNRLRWKWFSAWNSTKANEIPSEFDSYLIFVDCLSTHDTRANQNKRTHLIQTSLELRLVPTCNRNSRRTTLSMLLTCSVRASVASPRRFRSECAWNWFHSL